MKVVEVIIDGFKSYAVRTVISGWDESFNSITGLNGSGKSNILDSICFVLGITNMSTVRAQNLQDLIYKRGQAGVTKASVTIVFDNQDKKKSPIGFEEYAQISVTRQIVLGGTSKYLINGHRAQQHTVQNLFQSVQLNINNPNFLIMQGRITKVLNMKPVETLSMIEEAAGTRMFEDRRDKAFKTMAKKEMKVQEIAGLLREEIDPKLDKLRQEKRAFLDFQQTQNEVERMEKLVVAYDYIKHKDKSKQAGEDLEIKQRSRHDYEDSTKRLKTEIKVLQEDIGKVRAARDEELRKGGNFQSLEEQVKMQSHELVRLNTIIELEKTGIVDEEAKREKFEQSITELRSQVEEKMPIMEEVQQRYEFARTDIQHRASDVEKKEELLQSLQTGIASKEGQESGYQGQLQDARQCIASASTEQEQANLKIKHLEKRMKEDEPHMKKAKEQNTVHVRDLNNLRHQAHQLESDLSKQGVEPGKQEAAEAEEASLHADIRQLQSHVESIKRKVANIDFSYTDPSVGFDRSTVKGVVARLFTLDKQHSHAGTALEVCAGGRLYNVVVDTAETGTQLLQKGKLKKRVTIIPLNKIAALKVAVEKIGAAQKLAPGKVDLALSLVGHDHEVTAAMEYVFGSTLVCADAETAQKVTFDPSVRMKSVTLEGDVYDPSGTLSGGSAPQSSGVLVTLAELNEVQKELDVKVSLLADLQARLVRDKQIMEKLRKTKQELDLKLHEISLTEKQIENNSASSIIDGVNKMECDIKEAKQVFAASKVKYDEASKDIKRIEREMEDFSLDKDGKLTELQTSLAALRKALNQASIAIKPLQQELREAKIDLEQCRSDISAGEESLKETKSALEVMQEGRQKLVQEQQQVRTTHDTAQGQLDEERAKLTGFDEELVSLQETSQSKSSQVSDESLEMQKLGHQLEKLQKDKQASSQILTQMERDYDWISDEKSSFGRPKTAYDFQNQNMTECKSSLKTLTDRFQGMKKKINPKVMNMIDSVEKKEVALKNMMRTVVRDKKKIEETIDSLDEYKKEALQKTWSKVNGDFGHIFAELLPGSFAKLDPLEGKTIAEGLEVKVCLGKVWKQSLTELSGGQRSLIALSLIMALLQFKPAPMYILDEVDAALDLSHTQNIGRLIKTRFKGSQFIVVSLKDGMFQNANRIFRTRFSEGTSVVQALTPADLR
ncbi:MAG: Structural maintenance of chromosomes protein 2 [Chrysothrix sp. TS-e1954]|nr:MAG: Structural maintenance of chromosomes protein 2 [Chrysothrix sp. TS-e1954]